MIEGAGAGRRFDDEELPGHGTSEPELRSLGFVPLSIEVRRFLPTPEGMCCEWDTVGAVPEGPGHYLFTIEDGGEIRVAYAGLTVHLWMVTKGHLPRGGGARPGQRYGRPKYAGVTRRRINSLVAEQLGLGRRVRHWVRPLVHPPAAPSAIRAELLVGEEELITRWRLREVG